MFHIWSQRECVDLRFLYVSLQHHHFGVREDADRRASAGGSRGDWRV